MRMSLFSFVIDKEYSLLVSGGYEPSKNIQEILLTVSVPQN
jgi:hypothetical protein